MLILSLGLLTVLMRDVSSIQNGHFLGGSLSYSVEKTPSGQFKANIELVTSWILGQGPCGSSCNRNHVQQSTAVSRLAALSSDHVHFGNFTSEYNPPNGGSSGTNNKVKDVNAEVKSSFVEYVIAVNEMAKYEQELAKFSFIMESNPPLPKSEDINFDGLSWRPLQLQGGSNHKWHLQAKLFTSIRNDTNTFNTCPQVLSRPYYRVKLNAISAIKLSTVDMDGDFVRCEKADAGQESGGLTAAPDVTVNDDCSIIIDTNDPKYTDDAWIVVPVNVRDYPTQTINYGSDVLIGSGIYSMGTAGLQVLVNVKANLKSSMFIDPTFESNREFIVYTESTCRIPIFAEPPENTSLSEIVVTGRNLEPYQMSPVKADPKRPNIGVAMFSWTPTVADSGRHIACFSAVDSTGVESEEMRCCVLRVKESNFGFTSAQAKGGMSFIDIPSPQDLIQCPVKGTCILPIFVKSDIPVTKITIAESFSDESSIGEVSNVFHKGIQVFKADFTFRHTINDVINICFQAINAVGERSEKVCVISDVYPMNPCFSSPCQNSALCVNNNKTGTFECRCKAKNDGPRCESVKNFCPGFCTPEQHCINIPQRLKCVCPGYTGVHCEQDKNDCKTDPCGIGGICIDYVGTYKCACFSRYSNKKCGADACQAELSTKKACPIAACGASSCGRNGLCMDGPTCECSLGYNGTSCQDAVGDVSSQVTNVTFMAPSLSTGSSIVCYVKNNTAVPCEIPFFLTFNGNPPKMTFTTKEELQQTSEMTSLKMSGLINGVSKLYVVSVTIKGEIVDDDAAYLLCVNADSSSSKAEVCIQVLFRPDPLDEPKLNENVFNHRNKTATQRFESPTPMYGSKFLCQKDEKCWLLLYTTPSAGACPGTISSTTGSYVFPANYDANSRLCVSEAYYMLGTVGDHNICFQASDSDFETRCFLVDVYDANSDSCASQPCQNQGVCFHDGPGKFKCLCREGYSEALCQKGPCLENLCKNNGYCAVNNGTKTCMCQAGFSGNKCEIVEASGFGQSALSGATFKGIGLPTDIFCDRHVACGMSLLVVADNNSTNKDALVALGYVSWQIDIGQMVTQQIGTNDDMYLLRMTLMSLHVGTHILCLQTLSDQGVNKDEVCINVHVLDGSTLAYIYQDRPHFIADSPTPDLQVECRAHEQCHVVYHATVGHGNENDCLTVDVSHDADFRNIHHFSTCEPCGSGNQSSCVIDVSFIPDTMAVASNNSVCVKLTKESSGKEGEQRCFNVVVKPDSTSANAGCRALHCTNRGFCDGHDRSNTNCYCATGYIGTNCSGSIAKGPNASMKALYPDVATPNEIVCTTNTTCYAFFEVIGGINELEVVAGYVDNDISVCRPNVISNVTEVYSGYQKIYANKSGIFNVCLQSALNGVTTSEVCSRIKVEDTVFTVEKSKPYFLPPTPPSGSTLYCKLDTDCHIPTYFAKGEEFDVADKCPKIEQTSDPLIRNVHIFWPTQKPDQCISEVGIKVDSGSYSNGDTISFGIKLSLPGKEGEERQYTVKMYTNISSQVEHPCEGKICPDNFRCIGKPGSTNTSCICKMGLTGPNCTEEATYYHVPELECYGDASAKEDETPTSSTTNIAAIAGGSAGGLLGLIGLAGFVVLIKKQMQSKNAVSTDHNNKTIHKE